LRCVLKYTLYNLSITYKKQIVKFIITKEDNRSIKTNKGGSRDKSLDKIVKVCYFLYIYIYIILNKKLYIKIYIRRYIYISEYMFLFLCIVFYLVLYYSIDIYDVRSIYLYYNVYIGFIIYSIYSYA